jgi:ATP-binding cassette subfamily F protein uup
VQIAYYDQQREQLDPERTVFDTVGEGNDTVTANGRTRHVHAYLRDFLFSDERARSPVKALSGGERNRLLLARLFTRPANVLVLDEPTNDLDLETLELLEEQLVEWPGHAAARQPRSRVPGQTSSPARSCSRAGASRSSSAAIRIGCANPRRATNGGRGHNGRGNEPSIVVFVRCCPLCPLNPLWPPRSRASGCPTRNSASSRRCRARIEALESEQRALGQKIAGPEFYKDAADLIKASLARVDELQRELTAVYARWDALESRRKS